MGLYAIVPERCLQEGVRPSDASGVVTAFDPGVVPVQRTVEIFRTSGVLVEITDPYGFQPRLTGPDKSFHGFYAAQRTLRPEELEIVSHIGTDALSQIDVARTMRGTGYNGTNGDAR